MVTEYTELFKLYLRAFTKYDVNILLDSEPVFYEKDDEVEINYKHPLFSIPELDRLYPLIIREFLKLRQTGQIQSASPIEVHKLINAVEIDFFTNWLTTSLFPDLPIPLISALASEKYEGRDSTDLCAVFSPRHINYEAVLSDFTPIDTGERNTLHFSEIHAHRKFLCLTKRQCLVYERTTDENSHRLYKLVGITERDSALEKLPGILFLPHSNWAISEPPWMNPKASKSRFITLFRDYHFCLPEFPVYGLQEGWLKKRLFDIFGVSDWRPTYTILEQAQDQPKGALIILSDSRNAELLADKLCSAEMALKVGSHDNRLHLSEAPEYLDRFSAIDGAVLADFDGYCYAIGAILTGDAEKGNIGRGSRYNCTVSFLNSHKKTPYFAIVVSEDHIVNLLEVYSKSHILTPSI